MKNMILLVSTIFFMIACNQDTLSSIKLALQEQNYSRHSNFNVTVGYSFEGFQQSYPLLIDGDVSETGDFSGYMRVQDRVQRVNLEIDRLMTVVNDVYYFKYPDRNNWAKLSEGETSLEPTQFISKVITMIENYNDDEIQLIKDSNQYAIKGNFDSNVLAELIPVLKDTYSKLDFELIVDPNNHSNIKNIKISGKIPAASTMTGPNGEKVELDIDIQLIQSEFGKNVSILIPPIPDEPKAYFFDKQINQFVWDDAFRWDTIPENNLDSQVDYFAEIKMFDGGVILIDLYEKLAPITVNNFVFLSENGFYDWVTFHRVIPGFVAQGGDPTGSGMGGPGYKFDNEINTNARHDSEGIIAMANSGIQNGAGTNGSQFYITYVPLPQLDGFDENGLEKDCSVSGQSCHPVFGKVIEGMDLVDKIKRGDESNNGSVTDPDKIISFKSL